MSGTPTSPERPSRKVSGEVVVWWGHGVHASHIAEAVTWLGEHCAELDADRQGGASGAG